jgi:hypothetical protein
MTSSYGGVRFPLELAKIALNEAISLNTEGKNVVTVGKGAKPKGLSHRNPYAHKSEDDGVNVMEPLNEASHLQFGGPKQVSAVCGKLHQNWAYSFSSLLRILTKLVYFDRSGFIRKLLVQVFQNAKKKERIRNDDNSTSGYEN